MSFHPFYGSFHFFFCTLGYFFCVRTCFHCTFWRGHCLGIEWRRNLCIFLGFLLCLVWFLQILSSCSLSLICLFLCLFICLGPFLAPNVSRINSFLFLRTLVLRFFFTNLLSSAYSTLSFGVLLVFCLNSFLFLSKFSISVSSILFLIVDFCVLFRMVSIDSLRIVFIFFVDGSSSFRECQICFLVQFWREWLIFLTLWGLICLFVCLFCFVFFISLINFLLISTFALSIRWSVPISTLVMTSQFRTVFWSENSMKSICFLVTPPGASHVQYLFAAYKKNEFVITRLFSSAKSRSLSPLSFLLPVPRVLCISYCRLCFSLQFWRWSHPLLCGGCKLSCL